MPNIRAVVVDLGGVIFLPPSRDPWAWIGHQLGVPDVAAAMTLGFRAIHFQSTETALAELQTWLGSSSTK